MCSILHCSKHVHFRSKLCGAQYSTSKPKSSTIFGARTNQHLYTATKRWHSSQVCGKVVMTINCISWLLYILQQYVITTSVGMNSVPITLVAFSFYHLAQALALVEVFALSLSIHSHSAILTCPTCEGPYLHSWSLPIA